MEKSNGRTPAVLDSCSASYDVGQVVHFLAQHFGYQLHPRQIGDLVFALQLAVAQHGDAVAHRIHLVEEVGDKDDPDAAAFQLQHQLKQLFHFLLIQ